MLIHQDQEILANGNLLEASDFADSQDSEVSTPRILASSPTDFEETNRVDFTDHPQQMSPFRDISPCNIALVIESLSNPSPSCFAPASRIYWLLRMSEVMDFKNIVFDHNPVQCDPSTFIGIFHRHYAQNGTRFGKRWRSPGGGIAFACSQDESALCYQVRFWADSGSRRRHIVPGDKVMRVYSLHAATCRCKRCDKMRQRHPSHGASGAAGAAGQAREEFDPKCLFALVQIITQPRRRPPQLAAPASASPGAHAQLSPDSEDAPPQANAAPAAGPGHLEAAFPGRGLPGPLTSGADDPYPGPAVWGGAASDAVGAGGTHCGEDAAGGWPEAAGDSDVGDCAEDGGSELEWLLRGWPEESNEVDWGVQMTASLPPPPMGLLTPSRAPYGSGPAGGRSQSRSPSPTLQPSPLTPTTDAAARIARICVSNPAGPYSPEPASPPGQPAGARRPLLPLFPACDAAAVGQVACRSASGYKSAAGPAAVAVAPPPPSPKRSAATATADDGGLLVCGAGRAVRVRSGGGPADVENVPPIR